jgi:hypothetical protein
MSVQPLEGSDRLARLSTNRFHSRDDSRWHGGNGLRRWRLTRERERTKSVFPLRRRKNMKRSLMVRQRAK